MHVYVFTKCARPDGTFDSYSSQEVKFKPAPLPKAGNTIDGFGVAIPTQYKILWQGRWHRVKCRQLGRDTQFFIGRKYDPTLIVRFSEWTILKKSRLG